MDHVCCQHKSLKWLIKKNSNVSPVKSICLFVAGVYDNCEQIMIITPLWEADRSQWGSMATFHCHFWYFVSELPQGCFGMQVIVIPFLELNTTITFKVLLWVFSTISFLTNMYMVLYICVPYCYCVNCVAFLYLPQRWLERVTKCGGAFSPIFICEPHSCKYSGN